MSEVQQMQQPEEIHVQPQSQQPIFGVIKRIAIQLAVTYIVMNMFKSSPPAAKDQPSQALMFNNLFKPGQTVFDLFVYVNDQSRLKNDSNPFWVLKRVEYANRKQGPKSDGTFTTSGKVKLSSNVQNNGSLFLHACFTRSGNPFDSGTAAFCRSKQLNKYRKRVYRQTKNLLTGRTDKSEEDQQKAELKVIEILSMYHPNLTINLLDDQTAWSPSKMVAPLDKLFELASSTEYYPMVYFNDYWNLNSDYFELNSTVSEVDLNLVLSPIRLWNLQMYLSQEVKPAWSTMMSGGEDDNDLDGQDLIKQSLLETNVYLLALTIVVSIAHSFFEFLAFKNDIQFWRNKTDLEGLSVRSMLFNIFSSLIVTLYVFDNQSNFAIRLSAFFGFVIELWKVPKCLSVKVTRRSGIIPFSIDVSFKSSYVESSTSEYDKTAFKYLSIVLFPLVCCYAGYSLVYNEHRGWYSWLLSMIYGFLLTFGFIMMTPQLFINYKLKSVAHLPWRMMTYKALNTFVDDIFAFVVKTPILYRISCFRDDIVFFIYLYQRWIYKVDFSRVNEFGLVGDQPPTKDEHAKIE